MKKTFLALAAALVAAPALAATPFGDHVSLSGFGTVGVVSSDNDDVDFVRDGSPKGAGRRESWAVDSKLGIQADIKATSWLSATFQVLAEQRYEPGVKADLEWGFVTVKPVDGLSVRLGRTSPTVFSVSDSRNVGYANTTIRMPNEVYSLNTLKRLHGVDVSYRANVAGTWLTVSAMAGDGRTGTARAPSLGSEKVRGLNVVWETDFGSFRAGQASTDVVLDATVSPTGSTTVIPYTFSGIGYQYDQGNLIVGAEYVKRKVEGIFPFLGAKGWYVMGGYRFGNLTPYATLSQTRADEPMMSFISGNQDAWALGLRWDAVAGAALKVQVESVDPKGTMGASFNSLVPGPHAKTNVLSLAVDFVF